MTDEKLPELVCMTCSCSLSRFPVYACSECDTFKFICGRCPLIPNIEFQRQIAYESSVQDHAFQCMYKESGCNRKFCPKELIKHEAGCWYRPCVCLSLPLKKCSWKGRCGELHGHYVRCHHTMTFNDVHKIEFSLQSSFVDNYVARYDNEIFLLYIKYEFVPNVFFFSIGNVLTSRSSTYEITFATGDNEILQRFKIPVRSKDAFDFSNIKTPTDLRVVNLKKLDSCIIELVRNKDQVVDQMQGVVANVWPRLHEEMFKCAECPICMEYMRPPIMMCIAGHSICQICRTKITTCPTCREPFHEGRNFSLEDFTKFVAYPCKNRDHDCPVALPLDQIDIHEAKCGFKLFKCPFAQGLCTWRNKLSKVVEHMKDHHQRYYVKGKPFSTGLKPGDSSHGLIEYDQNMFYVKHQFDGTYYMALVGLIGPCNDASKYMFEFEISADDTTNPISIKRSCWFLGEILSLQIGSYIKLHLTCFDKTNIRQIFSYIHIMKKRLFD